jgi:hypothetical protein
MITTEFPGGVRLAVDVAEPDRLVACEFEADAQGRASEHAVLVVEALVGTAAARRLAEGAVPVFRVTESPPSAGVRNNLLRACLVVGLARNQARRSGWWSAEMLLLGTEMEILGLAPLAGTGVDAAARAYAGLYQEGVEHLGVSLRPRLRALGHKLLSLVQAPGLRKGVERALHHVTVHPRSSPSPGSNPSTVLRTCLARDRIITLVLLGSPAADLTQAWVLATRRSGLRGQIMAAGPVEGPARQGRLSCKLGLPSRENLNNLDFTIVTGGGKPSMAASRAACAAGSHAAALARSCAHSLSAGLWQDCARRWANLGNSDQEALAWQCSVREHMAGANPQAAQLAFAEASRLKTTWATRVTVGNPGEALFPEIFDPPRT